MLNTACEALAAGNYSLTGIEDVWATALKEGRTLFNSSRLWAATTAQQTGDMLGQTTMGPWQITIENAREYGATYGVNVEWNDREVASFLQQHPEYQARIAADFIENSYKQHGKRTPFGIQQYFWLDGFREGRIGQGPWYASVLAKKPAEMKKTGFYAKQLLVGSRFNPQGLLYWLQRTGDPAAIRDALKSWASAGYRITMDDLQHCECEVPFQEYVKSQ